MRNYREAEVVCRTAVNLSGMQASVCFHLEGRAVHLELTPQGWKHNPTICHGLIQAALENCETPEYLQFFDDIVWSNMAEEVFEKGEKITQIFLKASSAIKQS